jgi:hypothetical protein
MERPDPRRGRVARSHTVATTAFRLAAVFIVWAAVWAVGSAIEGGGSWWGPLHLFMAGAVLLAISGATQLFSVTWAAAVPPDRRLAGAQRWAVAAGAAAAVIGVTREVAWLTITGAVLVGAGLVGLGWILVGIVRRSLLRRFDLPARFYLLAVGSGIVGVTLGAVLGTDSSGEAYLDVRTAHMHLNVVGLVGLTILGTLPTLLPTTVRHRMVSGREAVAAWWGCVGGTGLMASGMVWGPVPVGVGVGLVAVSGAALLGGIVIRIGVRQVAAAGLPALLITTGTAWLLGRIPGDRAARRVTHPLREGGGGGGGRCRHGAVRLPLLPDPGARRRRRRGAHRQLRPHARLGMGPSDRRQRGPGAGGRRSAGHRLGLRGRPVPRRLRGAGGARAVGPIPRRRPLTAAVPAAG